MGVFELDEEQQAMIFDALKGDSNERELTSTRKDLVKQKLHAGVSEVDRRLFVLKGNGKDRPGLLRIFDPQADLTAHLTPATVDDGDTGSLFEGIRDGDGALMAPTAGPGESFDGALEWSDEVPEPRPEAGTVIALPPHAASEAQAEVTVVDVLGYNPERAAFRVVDSAGVDGLIVHEGGEWRILDALLEYGGERESVVAEELAAMPQGATEAEQAGRYAPENEEPANIGGQPGDE